MEEFLELLITIVGERFEPRVGCVTNEEKLTREVVHQLCIAPMAHSELVRALQDSGQIETVSCLNRLTNSIDLVTFAIFFSQGLGELESILKNVADLK